METAAASKTCDGQLVVYNAAADAREYTRSLLSEEERKKVDDDTAKNGFMKIDDVRSIIRSNSSRESASSRGEVIIPEPEVMITIDARVNYNIFIAGGDVYSREEIVAAYPFDVLQIQPEAVFMQQEIGVFPPRKYSMDNSQFEYIARDVGDETVAFVMIEDLVGQATRANYKKQREAVRVVKTKIYVGREKWDNFTLLCRFANGVNSLRKGGGRNPLARLLAPNDGQLLLTDGEEGHLRREKEAAERHAARMEEIRQRDEESKKREEQLREIDRKIQADIARLEKMLSAPAAVIHPNSSEIKKNVPESDSIDL